MLKTGGPRVCEICGNYYTPKSLNQRYCPSCLKMGKSKYNKEYREKTKTKKARAARSKSGLTWPEINKICSKYHISYGQAMAKGILTKEALEAET